MKPPEPLPGKLKPARLEEAHRILEEYAAGPREIIKKLRRYMN
jgi:hypothetical protein